MPTYDYACGACGSFEALRPIARRDEPARCPGCGAVAARSAVGAARLAVLDAGLRRLIDGQERAAGGPARASAHPLSCGCCRPRRSALRV